MVPVAPNAPASPCGTVDGSRRANDRTHEPTREANLVVRLDEQMNVIGLHRIVDDPKPRPHRSTERPSQCSEHDLSA
jgi:hypothetical protein